MKLDEYASYDGLGLGELVAKGDVTPTELARTAAAAIKAVNGETKAVIETYEDRIDGLDEEYARAWPVPRRAVPDEGRVRPRAGPAHRVRLAAVPGHDGHHEHLLHRSAQGGGRQHPRPHGGARILDVGDDRERDVRQHVEPVEEGLFGGRLVGWRAVGGHERHGADRARLGHRRLDPHSRELVRRRRPQAVARARLDRAGR